MEELMHTGRIRQKIWLSFEIAKLPLCSLVAFSALFGNLYAWQHIQDQALYIFFGVFLLACGCASLNSFQERFHDELLERTRSRPLVQKSVSSNQAVVQALLLLSLGLLVILISSNIKAFLAGIGGIVIYNFIYTVLKSKSIYAIVPGAIAGAIPPCIGWLAAGGSLFSHQAMLLVLLLFFWQIPHFFLVLLNHRDDYSQSISPNLLQDFSESALKRIFLPWITALAIIMIIFCLVPPEMGLGGKLMILANCTALLGIFYYQMLKTGEPKYNFLFRILNCSLLLFMATVCFQAAHFSEFLF